MGTKTDIFNATEKKFHEKNKAKIGFDAGINPFANDIPENHKREPGIIYAHDIDPSTGVRYLDHPSYWRDGRIESMMGKHLRELDLPNTKLGEYLCSRQHASCAAAGVVGIAWEYLRTPVNVTRFLIAKYGSKKAA